MYGSCVNQVEWHTQKKFFFFFLKFFTPSDLAAFYGDYQLYATNDEELSGRTKAKIAAMIDADENCYLYESNGGMKEFEFFTTDCGLFLPTFCAKGPQSGTCTQSLTYDTK